ncbi:MAG: hypothetical protein ACREPR_05260 [Brasilonema sp.]
MKSKLLSFSLFSLTALSPFFIPSLTPSASAGCVGVSAGTQVAISKNPSQQGTTVNREFGKDCNGNSAVSTGSQVCFNDSSSCNQRRTVNQRIDGSGNRTGVKTPNINVDVNPNVKVRLPHNYPSGR